jgi:hypothetical protein
MSTPAPPLKTVRVGDLTVTMATGPELRAEAARRSEEAESLMKSAAKIRSDAISMLVESGMILVARAGEWSKSQPEAAPQLADAMRAIKVIDDQDGGFDPNAGRGRGGISGLFSRKKAPAETDEARQAREERNAALRVILAELGRAYGGLLPAVAQSQARALALEHQAVTDRERATRLQAEAADLDREAGHRDAAVAAMGFDAVHTAALLQETPPPPVETPLALRGDEKAFLVEAAELARQKTAANPNAAAGGLPFPVEETGVPYRVGTYRSQPIPQDSLTKLGAGTFVVTSERLGFVGTLKSFSFPLSGLLQVEQFKDGLTLLREGRDHADVLLTPAAGRILFYINWVLQPAPGSS